MSVRKIYILVENRNNCILHGAFRSAHAATILFEELVRASLAAPKLDLTEQKAQLEQQHFVQMESNCSFEIKTLDSPY